ncbi:condensin-2 complex subunit G2-like [Lineus longissimus]|uniref:condensin-2 complex subunit G2-like n=1 Tax=Lineus longissimus TaxID=88925 RepID=UPI00315D8C5D
MDVSILNESHNDRTDRKKYIKKLQAQKTADVREAFVKAAKDGEVELFCDFMEKNACKADLFDVTSLVDILDFRQLDDLWKGLNAMCMNTLLSFEDGQEADVMDVAAKMRSTTLQGIVTVALATIAKDTQTVPKDLYETALVLNGILSTLPEIYKKVKDGISKLCETWCTSNMEGREHLISQTMIYLIEESLEPKPQARLLKRLWTMRDGLVNLNLEDESSAHLRELLLQCVIQVPHIKNDDGRKFLIFLFGLNINFIETLHKAIKQQIPVCPKSILDWYAEIYFKAWKASTGLFREKIEIQCIQDLMYHAVHASRSSPKPMSSTLRKFLTYFHNQKHQRGVDGMLLRLYEPFIWRSVKVANSNVRANAVALLIDAFPLNREGATNVETDNLVQKQLDIFQSLMYDPCPTVRVTAILGVCRICKDYWELIPPNNIIGFMQNIINDLAWDCSTADVRVSVLRGLTHLVGQHLCHPMLNTLLPRLQNMIHDNSEKVRVAMVDLLLKIKGMRLIKVWHVVSMDHLLVRLTMDSAPVVRRIANLIHSSFMPADKSPEVLLSRCVALLQANPAAARKFYRYVPARMSLTDIGKFMLLTCNFILNCIMREDPEMKDRDESQMPEEEEDSMDITVHNVDIMAGFMETLAILWTGISHLLETPEAAQIKRALEKKFVMALPRFFKVFQDPRICSAMVLLAGHLPANNLPMFSKSCLSKLRNMHPDQTPEEYGPMLESMCSWGKVDDVLELVAEWFSRGLEMATEEVGKKGAKERKVCFQDPVDPKPVLGLHYMSYLVRGYACREVVLKDSLPRLREITAQLKTVMACIRKRFETNNQLSKHCSDEFLVEAFEMYCKLEVLLHDPEDNTHSAVASFEQLLPWADIELLSALGNTAAQAGEKRALSDADASALKELAEKLVDVLLTVAGNMFLVGVGDEEFSSLIADFANLVLDTDSLPTLILPCVKLLYQMTEYTYSLKTDETDEGIGTNTDVIPGMLSRVVQALAKIIRNHLELSTKIFHDVKPAFGEAVRAYYSHPNSLKIVSNDVMATIMAAVVSEVTRTVAEEGEVLSCKKVQELPPLSNLLMDVVVKQNKLCSLFLEELHQCTKAGVLQDIQGYTAVLHILDIIMKAKPTSSALKDCVMTVQLKFEELEEPDMAEDSVKIELYKETKNLLHNNMNTLGVVM